MKIQFSEHQGTQRKPLVKAIEELTGSKGKYRMDGAMKYAWDFGGGMVLHRDGTLVAESHIDADGNSGLPAQLNLRGFVGKVVDNDGETPEQANEDMNLTEREELGLGRERRKDPQGESGPSPSDVPDTMTIELPFTSTGDLTKAKVNLTALIQSKATLIGAALGGDGLGGLPVEFTDGTVKFEWLRFGAEPETIQAWSAFLCAAVNFAKKAQRVTAKDGMVENEKFHFRAFLVRIGLNDAANKAHRKVLLHNLKGDAAFATAESKERWQAKHLNKKTEGSDDGNE